jgi:hypothetical protein
MVNGSKDLYSLLSFIGHPTISNMKFESFKSRFCNMRDPMSLDALSQEMVDSVASFTHKDKLLDARLITIPKPHNKSLRLNPTKLEIEIYSVVRARFKERAQSLDENGEMKSNKFHIWAMFTLLRQLTAHPLLVPMKVSDYLEPEDFVKIEKAVEKQATSDETPVSTIHALRELMKKQRTRAETRAQKGVKIDMSETGPMDDDDEGIDDVEELRAHWRISWQECRLWRLHRILQTQRELSCQQRAYTLLQMRAPYSQSSHDFVLSFLLPHTYGRPDA